MDRSRPAVARDRRRGEDRNVDKEGEDEEEEGGRKKEGRRKKRRFEVRDAQLSPGDNTKPHCAATIAAH